MAVQWSALQLLPLESVSRLCLALYSKPADAVKSFLLSRLFKNVPLVKMIMKNMISSITTKGSVPAMLKILRRVVVCRASCPSTQGIM